MYRVMIVTDGKEYLLHDPRDDEAQLIEPVVTLEAGKNGSFEFRIAPTHPNVERIQALSSEILVYDDNELLFCGRAIKIENDFYNIGKIYCEGELAYLLDSMQRPYDFTGNAAEFFRQVLEVHNSQVEERKRFEVGAVTVADSSPEVRRTNTECLNTLATLRAQLTDQNDGYLVIRRAGGKKYLDYVSDYGGMNEQVIRFGENLLDMTKYLKPIGIVTALVPYGGAPESADTEAEPQPVDITSVNGGKDYIYDQAAVDTYGWIWGTQKWDDILDPETLLAKARAYLQETIVMPVTLDLKAVDLGLIDVDIQRLRIGRWTQVESVPHKISKRFLLSKKMIHLDDPGKDEVILGQTLMTFTASVNKKQKEMSARIKQVANNASKEINRKIENATQLITGGKGGYVVLDIYDPDTGEKMHPWRILIMDAPEKDQARSVIQINKNGIGFSTTGIMGPYRNAWTIDGNLVADFITSGSMLADRIRGGILEVGGSGLARDGKIVVKDARDRQIGYWDKTGLHVLLGVIEGSTIIGSDIIGGTIDIGDGTFSVDEDGAVVINTGEISIGAVRITQNYIDLGAFRVSSNDMGYLFSMDSGSTIRIASKNAIGENGPAIILSDQGRTTRIGRGSIATHDIDLQMLENEYGIGWESIGHNIIELWNRVIALENSK